MLYHPDPGPACIKIDDLSTAAAAEAEAAAATAVLLYVVTTLPSSDR